MTASSYVQEPLFELDTAEHAQRGEHYQVDREGPDAYRVIECSCSELFETCPGGWKEFRAHMESSGALSSSALSPSR